MTRRSSMRTRRLLWLELRALFLCNSRRRRATSGAGRCFDASRVLHTYAMA
ncbi:hypothetical protein PMIN01_09439 [Paraphaeosphaeria minitans]|uniref:Uncharacterized protein n=1 Tax=Paraphaeosphaeria minitans TaxID=565426 RepID=A0A9P6KNB7_9PLEO|nr:hypothetical protein PMIN01_09439 [Paraphaeosphaeria minitans]